MIGHNSGDRPRGNWIAMSRDVREHPIVGFNLDAPRSEFEAWYDLLCMANYKPMEVMSRGYKVSLDIGQLVAARGWLATRWMWTERRVRSFMEQLERDGMVVWSNAPATRVQKGGLTSDLTSDPTFGLTSGSPKHRLASVVTVCNYSKYQYLTDQIEAYTNRQNGLTPGLASDPTGDHNLTKETTKQEKEGAAPVGAPAQPKAKAASASRGTRLPEDWKLPDVWRDEAVRRYVVTLNEVHRQAERFRDYWIAQPGQRGVKSDWQATWRNWISRDRQERPSAAKANGHPIIFPWLLDARQSYAKPEAEWLSIFGTVLVNGHWDPRLGPPPLSDECLIPPRVVDRLRLKDLYTWDGKRTGKPLPWAKAEQGSLLP